VVFAFSDRTRGVSEETADFLVSGLLRRLSVPEAAQSAADKIAEQRNAGTLQEPGREIKLYDRGEALRARGDRPPDRPDGAGAQLIELRAALVASLPPGV